MIEVILSRMKILVSLEIVNDIEPSNVATSNETTKPDNECHENGNGELANDESHENPDNINSQTQAPLTSSGDLTESDEQTTTPVQSHGQPAPRCSGHI